MSGSWIAGTLVAVACAAIETAALVDRSRGEPGNGGIRRYVLGEIVEDLQVDQEFLVKANGLSSVTVHPRPTTPEPSGTATLALLDVTGTDAAEQDGVVVTSVSVPLATLVQSDTFTLEFAPQPSWYRRYRLEVTVADAPRGRGFGLLAARGDGHRDASMRINGTRKWGDLVFETSVAGAASNFGTLRSRFSDAGVPGPGIALATLLLVQYVALAAVLGALFRSGFQSSFFPGRT